MISSTRPLEPHEVATLLRAGAASVFSELEALPDEVASWHPTPGEWCAKEVVGHLIESEKRGFAGRIRDLLEQAEPRLEDWDPPTIAENRRDCDKPVQLLLDEFAAAREASTGLVEGLSAADLSRGGEHPSVGRLTVADLLHEWLHHDREHIRQLFGCVDAFVWPHMGNTRRFSDPVS